MNQSTVSRKYSGNLSMIESVSIFFQLEFMSKFHVFTALQILTVKYCFSVSFFW